MEAYPTRCHPDFEGVPAGEDDGNSNQYRGPQVDRPTTAGNGSDIPDRTPDRGATAEGTMGSVNLPGIGPEIESRIARIDDETLTPVVRAALDDDEASVAEWERTPILAGAGGGYFGTALFRVSGTAETGSGTREWSVVLKVLAERPGEVPTGHPYWKREAEAYGSAFLRDVPGGLVPARAYRIDEYPGESVWLWLDDLEDEYGGEWPLDGYRRAARHLGEFNGAFLAERDVPAEPWVIERTFDFSRTAGVVALVDRVPDDPVVTRHFPTATDRERLLAAWRDRDRFLAAREALPETFCHFDAFGRNLFAVTRDGTARTVAIDWDQCGIARIGDDAGALVVLTLMFLDWPVARADELERAVLAGYREGLAAAGWDGTADTVRRGYRLHIVARWLEWVGIAVRLTVDDRNHDWIADLIGTSIDEILDENHRLHRFAFDTVDAVTLDDADPDAASDGASNATDSGRHNR